MSGPEVRSVINERHLESVSFDTEPHVVAKRLLAPFDGEWI